MRYKLIFDKVILKQLKNASRDKQIKTILTKMLDKIEELGPRAGKILDPQLGIYEVKAKHPPIRLYFRHIGEMVEIYIFEYDMKKSPKHQKNIIKKIVSKILKS